TRTCRSSGLIPIWYPRKSQAPNPNEIPTTKTQQILIGFRRGLGFHWGLGFGVLRRAAKDDRAVRPAEGEAVLHRDRDRRPQRLVPHERERAPRIGILQVAVRWNQPLAQDLDGRDQ